MYHTRFGAFDGDSWEQLMQICFRLKYELEHYQPVPASSGDCGIEGFTKKGKVFQCYCPDNNITSSALYEKQRDKITRDLNKLNLYQKKLCLFLVDVKITEWIFVTPENRTNDLIIHCNNKVEEVISWNLSFIDPSLKVIVHDIDHFVKEIPIAMNGNGQKLMIGPDSPSKVDVIKWKEQENSLVDNAIRKHAKRFPTSNSSIDKKVNDLTESTIKSYFDRESILSRWQRIHPLDYDRFLVLVSQIEKDVEERCMFPTTDNNELYLSLRSLVNGKLKENFSYLDETTINNLTHGAIADWILRCPLDFE